MSYVQYYASGGNDQEGLDGLVCVDGLAYGSDLVGEHNLVAEPS